MTRPILIVEDDPAITSVLREALELEGYTVETATNGVQALRALERSHPQLVVLDLHMPTIDGWGFARGLRKRGIDLPLVVISATSDARDVASEIGADAFIPKPFEPSAVLTAVRRFVGARSPG